MDQWFNRTLYKRAPATGTLGVNGRAYKAGQFMPFYVPRPVMPQIDEEHYNEFLAFVQSHGIGFFRCAVNPETVHPHQRIDPIHAERMPLQVRAKPALVSRELYILDGNHRWLLHYHEHSCLNIIWIDLPFFEAIGLMFKFPKTYALEDQNERN